MLLAIANRPIDSNTTFSTGGDVSRFQRRTVPGKRRRHRCWAMPWPASARASARRMPVPAAPDRSGGPRRSRQ